MTATLKSHYSATLRLGLPIAVGQVGVILMGFADTMMVGHYSTDSLAAASFVNNLFNLVTFLLMGYSYGLTPLVSAHCGRGERGEAGACLKNALVANGLYGLLLLGAMTALYFFLDRMGQPEEILPLVRPYYIVVLVSMVFVMGFPLGMGIHGIFLAFSIGLFTAAALFFFTFRKVVARQQGGQG